MINYIAPNPYPVQNSGFISWLLSSLSFSSTSVGQGIGQLILPAQMRDAQQVSQSELHRFAMRLI